MENTATYQTCLISESIILRSGITKASLESFGFFQNGNLVCGGEYWDSRSHCLLFVNGEWVSGPDLVMGRTYHTSWTVDSDLTLLVGGGSSQTSTELVDTSMNSSTLYFDLIYPSV